MPVSILVEREVQLIQVTNPTPNQRNLSQIPMLGIVIVLIFFLHELSWYIFYFINVFNLL